MRKTLASFLLLAAAALAASAVLAATVTVLVQETKVRKRPQFFAPAVATAKLGDSFDATGPASGWYKTDSGWLHESAVTAKKVRVDASASAGGGASAEEVTLAGKGFNAQVEQSYGAKHPEADFAGVGRMEERGVPDAEVLRFLRAGGLLAGEDAR